eukprot:COSAG04_NODE_5656_length_1537_cov_6.184284_2_plen_246_part_00
MRAGRGGAGCAVWGAHKLSCTASSSLDRSQPDRIASRFRGLARNWAETLAAVFAPWERAAAMGGRTEKAPARRSASGEVRLEREKCISNFFFPVLVFASFRRKSILARIAIFGARDPSLDASRRAASDWRAPARRSPLPPRENAVSNFVIFPRFGPGLKFRSITTAPCIATHAHDPSLEPPRPGAGGGAHRFPARARKPKRDSPPFSLSSLPLLPPYTSSALVFRCCARRASRDCGADGTMLPRP